MSFRLVKSYSSTSSCCSFIWLVVALGHKWQWTCCFLVVRVSCLRCASSSLSAGEGPRDRHCPGRRKRKVYSLYQSQTLSKVKKQTLQSDRLIINIFRMFLPHTMIMLKLRTDLPAIYGINMQRNMSSVLFRRDETLGWGYIPMR